MRWFKKIENEYGNYVDASGKRYMIDYGTLIVSPEKKYNNELGYEEFVDLHEAITAWGLKESLPGPRRK